MIGEFNREYEFLSNFYLSPVEFDGDQYPSVENAFQAAKEVGDRTKFKSCSPGQAKRFGRKVKLRSDWEEIKIAVMTAIVRNKFTIPDLKEKLLATGDEELVEGNWWRDTFWGVYKGCGRNELGKILMKVRQELRGQHVGSHVHE